MAASSSFLVTFPFFLFTSRLLNIPLSFKALENSDHSSDLELSASS